jgi:hypothetical protein
MESTGEIFEPVRVSASAPVAAPVTTPATGEAATANPFAFPEDPPIRLSSEQMAAGSTAVTLGAAAGVDVEELMGAAPSAAASPSAPAAPPAVGLPSATSWPVRLVSTLPQAQPPRAILGLPDGREQVVSPGAILPEQGLVVMSVTADRVQLAQVRPAGDHATIETIEIGAQYPTRPAAPAP